MTEAEVWVAASATGCWLALLLSTSIGSDALILRNPAVSAATRARKTEPLLTPNPGGLPPDPLPWKLACFNETGPSTANESRSASARKNVPNRPLISVQSGLDLSFSNWSDVVPGVIDSCTSAAVRVRRFLRPLSARDFVVVVLVVMSES